MSDQSFIIAKCNLSRMAKFVTTQKIDILASRRDTFSKPREPQHCSELHGPPHYIEINDSSLLNYKL